MRENYHDPRRSFYQDETYRYVKGAISDIYRLATDKSSGLPRQKDYQMYYGVSGMSMHPETAGTLRAARFCDDDIYLDMFSENNGVTTYHGVSIREPVYISYTQWSQPEIGGRNTYRRSSLPGVSESQLAVAGLTRMYELVKEEADAGWPHRFDDELMERARSTNRAMGVKATRMIPAIPNSRYL